MRSVASEPMARTRVRRRRAGLIVLVTVLLVAGAGPVGRALTPHAGARPARYVVREGDSVWSIAAGAGRGGDPRALVDEIVRVNGVDPGRLVPGQTLLIPADG